MAKACNYTKYAVIALLAILAVVIVMQCTKKKAERFEMLAGMDEAVSARPNLMSALAPRSNLPELASNPLLGDPMNGIGQMGAAPPNPIDLGMAPPAPAQTFAAMGAAPEAPNVALSSQQAQDMLGQSINGGTPQYMEAQLPLGDIHQVGMDATDPDNFMYNRTVFAPLKRQFGNQVDFIRGDIDVKQEFRGWFDARPATQKDIVTGYFDRYIDIQQETAIRDSNWSRSTPVQTLYNNAINVGGNTQYNVMSSL